MTIEFSPKIVGLYSINFTAAICKRFFKEYRVNWMMKLSESTKNSVVYRCAKWNLKIMKIHEIDLKRDVSNLVEDLPKQTSTSTHFYFLFSFVVHMR